MRKRFLIILLTAILLAMACGCQSTPEKSVVVSKNDGAFENALQSTNGEEQSEPPQELTSYSNSFTSSDGKITYDVQIENFDLAHGALPVLQVTPMTFTSEQAQHVAEVLFDGATVYEYSEQMSKSQLEEKILSLKQLISDRTSLLAYYGGDEELTDYVTAKYESMIAQYEQAYDSAPESMEAKLCDWQFRPDTYYSDYAGRDMTNDDFINTNKTLYVEGTATVDGLPYTYWVINREEEDYRIHSIYAFVDDLQVPSEVKYSTAVPTDEDIENTRAMAESILEEIQLGEWIIDSCTVSPQTLSDGGTGYQITLLASPVYDGVKVTLQNQLGNLKTGDEYASNYYYEQIEFHFSGGRLVFFLYESPLEVVSVVNENVSTLSFDEAMERFKTQMGLTVLNNDMSSVFSGVNSMTVKVEAVELGLTRTRIKNNSTDFYLVPSYTFYGSYYNASGKAIQMEGGAQQVLLAINAVDGSVIDVSKGY